MIIYFYKKAFLIFIYIFVLNTLLAAQEASDIVNGNLIQFNDNGAWCWYQDERAIVDTTMGKLLLGSDASGSGTGGSNRNGNIEGIIYDLAKGSIEKSVFWKPGCDDHNVPAFLIRPDGKYITMYAEHYDYYDSHYRIYDGLSWSAEQVFDWETIPGGINYTIAYSNLYYLSDEGNMYNFARANNRCPNFIYSTDLGESWLFGGQLSTNNTTSYNKGYYKYWSNGTDRIDFICTEEHPRDGLTSMYHGYIQNGMTHYTYGTVVDSNVFDVENLPTFEDFTLIFADNTIINGKAMRKIWIADLMRYDDGIIAAILTCRIDNAVKGNDTSIDPDHGLIYCRFDGVDWSYTYLGQAGKKMYSSEADYTGLGALHPNDPDRIYISTHVDPRTDLDITYREIFEGVTEDNGATWSWEPITEKSNQHNFRPVVPLWNVGNTVLLWFRGTYNAAQNFDAAIVGIIEQASDNVNQMTYIDANASNTALADGSPLSTTGPDGDKGPADDQWHERTGFGNSNSVYTSAEISGENAPALKTTVNLPEEGKYDFWINFWANPEYDWRIKAGLFIDDMQIFRQMASTQVEDGDHSSTLVLTGGGNTYLYQAYLGRIQVESADSVEIFIDDHAIQTGTTGTLIGDQARTWYDGISYANVDDINVIVSTDETGWPSEFALNQNFPNPFNPVTKISYAISTPSHVMLIIYNVLGQEVHTLVYAFQQADNYTVDFNGGGLSSGIYYYQLKINHRWSQTKKMILIK
ncbi:MAG: T9SS type A sorting domain-containing protein [Calditrichaceae bacterium]|nr:T9SS type A sorting domain-containing protein [Calditrichaceae bacterium]MBN2708340.1 T9SS type A sorting domain-containing protein [Calditrichaceae bacterium]RQV95229.1 MAG: T9SS C-terminal target domain-containing protein [Calditrichota bacterium]